MGSQPTTPTSHRKKTVLLTTGVLALAVGALALVAVVNNNNNAINADTDDTLLGLDSDTNINTETMDLSVKVVNATGAAKTAFLDAIVDANGNGTIDANEESNGFSFETEADGTALLTLPTNQYYSIRALSLEGEGEGTVAVALGSVEAAGTAKAVRAANPTDPVVITIAQ
jgi:hypothetical protein